MTLQETMRKAIKEYFKGNGFEANKGLESPLKYDKKFFDEKAKKYKSDEFKNPSPKEDDVDKED